MPCWVLQHRDHRENGDSKLEGAGKREPHPVVLSRPVPWKTLSQKHRVLKWELAMPRVKLSQGWCGAHRGLLLFHLPFLFLSSRLKIAQHQAEDTGSEVILTQTIRGDHWLWILDHDPVLGDNQTPSWNILLFQTSCLAASKRSSPLGLSYYSGLQGWAS
jgi:hypothetical protein